MVANIVPPHQAPYLGGGAPPWLTRPVLEDSVCPCCDSCRRDLDGESVMPYSQSDRMPLPTLPHGRSEVGGRIICQNGSEKNSIRNLFAPRLDAARTGTAMHPLPGDPLMGEDPGVRRSAVAFSPSRSRSALSAAVAVGALWRSDPFWSPVSHISALTSLSFGSNLIGWD